MKHLISLFGIITIEMLPDRVNCDLVQQNDWNYFLCALILVIICETHSVNGPYSCVFYVVCFHYELIYLHFYAHEVTFQTFFARKWLLCLCGFSGEEHEKGKDAKTSLRETSLLFLFYLHTR
jgi:hypothetical protein